MVLEEALALFIWDDGSGGGLIMGRMMEKSGEVDDTFDSIYVS